MAHIKKMTDKPRKLPWRAQVHRNGQQIVKMFKTREDAVRWANEQERNFTLHGLPLTNKELKKIKVRDIVERYWTEITPEKASAQNEFLVLRRFSISEFGSLSLASVTKQHAYDYIAARLKDHHNGERIKPSTVRREINSIQQVFEVAREQWGFSQLTNPFRGIRIKGSVTRRTRRLEKGELRRLNAACRRCLGRNKQYIPLALYLAIETGMRLQEIFNLQWGDVDILERRINIRKSKTDYLTGLNGRKIVMSVMAQMLFTQLRLRHGKLLGQTELVFPMTASAFKQAWADVVRRAGIQDLTFHDLRREAGSRFHEADLTKPEHDLMLGHSNRDMTSLYIKADLKRIEEKLDRHALKGQTLSEAMSDLKKMTVTDWAEEARKVRESFVPRVMARAVEVAKGA